MAKNIKARAEDYSQWYLDVIKAAQLADYAPVKGCMVIRPEGYAMWEAIQRDLDRRFKDTGHVNAYFPLLIPMSFLAKEAEHVEGFAKECAVVTHSRLQKLPTGKARPASELEEPLVIRPTSETIIGHMYAQWMQSYRDLPVLINQWCNVMRWEMRTRLFLRTAEFLWQEGHTAHETADEAQEETLRMLDVYAAFAEEFLAMPVIKGEKTDAEKFPGAVTTYCIEALMQDGKALQAGTSHFLGQNFSKAFDIKFLGRDQKQEHAWTTSWGVSTRLIGALIMAHSDDEGLVLPPKVAPTVVAIVPIFRGDEERATIKAFTDKLVRAAVRRRGAGAARVGRRHRELPVGSRDAPADRGRLARQPAGRQAVPLGAARRAVPHRGRAARRGGGRVRAQEADSIAARRPCRSADASRAWLVDRLDQVQRDMLGRARAFRDASTRKAESYDEMKTILASEGGFVRCFFKPDRAIEAKIKDETKATVRCIPLEQSGLIGALHLYGRADGHRSPVRSRILARKVTPRAP